MKKKRKRKKRRIGSSFLLALCVLLALTAMPGMAAKKKPTSSAFGRVAVSVFREPGFALPEAEVRLTSSPEGQVAEHKSKPATGFTDSRGEFVFRVPVAAMKYVVRASAKGFHAQEKTISMEGEQTLDVTFTLATESK